jgi:hypothetical protein
MERAANAGGGLGEHGAVVTLQCIGC